jgi:hypothetical protein
MFIFMGFGGVVIGFSVCAQYCKQQGFSKLDDEHPQPI